MNFDIFPDSKKTLKNLFVIFLIVTSFLGGLLVSKSYFDRLVGQKNEEYSKEISVLKETLHEKEVTHSKEVSLLKSEYEKSLKQKIIRETQADGSSKEVIENDVNETKKETIEVVKEVEVIKYVDRVIEVEKVVEKKVIITNNTNWSLGVSIQPQLNVPYFNNFTVDLGYSITNNIDVFTSYSNNLEFNNDTYSLGIRIRF